MSVEQLAGIAAAAMLVFWMLGAHNRLVALRNDIGAAWAQLDEPLQRRAAALTPLLAGLRSHLNDEQGTLDAVAQAQAQVRTACDALRLRPAVAAQAAALVAAESALAAAQSRMLALLEHRAELRTDPQLGPHADALRDTQQRMAFARQLFNDAVQRYNDAARQFPTRLLARLFGFGPAGAL